MKLTAIISAISAFIIGVFAFLFKNEKGKRIKAEERAEQKEKEVETIKVEKQAEQQAAATIQEAQTKVDDVNIIIEDEIKEVYNAVVSDQAKLYNNNVNKWKKIKR